MICKHCNTMIPDISIHCPVCGKPTEAQATDPAAISAAPADAIPPYVPPTPPVAAPSASAQTASVAAPNRLVLPKKAIVGIIAGAGAVIVILLSVWLLRSLGKRSLNETVEAYLQAYAEMDGAAAVDLIHEDYLREMLSGTDLSKDQYVLLIQAQMIDWMQEWQAELGALRSHSWEINKSKKLTLQYSADSIQFLGLRGMSAILSMDETIEDMQLVELTVTFDFEQGYRERVLELPLFKIDGGWYLMSFDF